MNKPAGQLTIRQRWNGSFYDGVEPRDLGLDIQLGHPPGETCDMRALYTRDRFTLITANGVKTVRMYFCQCSLSGHVPGYVQLIRRRYWPATCDDPESATTFEALDLFTRLSALGRLNVYDFYRALEASVDGAMLRGVSVRALWSSTPVFMLTSRPERPAAVV